MSIPGCHAWRPDGDIYGQAYIVHASMDILLLLLFFSSSRYNAVLCITQDELSECLQRSRSISVDVDAEVDLMSRQHRGIYNTMLYTA